MFVLFRSKYATRVSSVKMMGCPLYQVAGDGCSPGNPNDLLDSNEAVVATQRNCTELARGPRSTRRYIRIGGRGRSSQSDDKQRSGAAAPLPCYRRFGCKSLNFRPTLLATFQTFSKRSGTRLERPGADKRRRLLQTRIILCEAVYPSRVFDGR